MKATAARTTAALTVALFAGLASVGRAQTSDTTPTVKDDASTAGHAVAHGATALGHSVAEKSRAAGHKIADDSRTARDAVRDDSKKAGHSMAEAARNVGRAVRDGFNRVKAELSGKPSQPEPKG
jgi:hypothetical protein